jgi:phosphoribosyl-ATP pyrophosphohydrolase/phosphoribosyl-AMP cyclohydrolase/histidinol dehydrogenase
LDKPLIEAVNANLETQLKSLSTSETAGTALKNGFAVLAENMASAVEICDRLAPEHLALQVENAGEVARRCSHYGALFVGDKAAEVLGDYGAGPNHTLPTGGTARHSAGLSVFDFLRIRTWMRIDDPSNAEELLKDAKRLADLEGLAGHANSAKIRMPKQG